MKKYGLNLRISSNQQKQSTPKPPLPPPAFAFRNDDDDNDAEAQISRQASKNKALQKIEEQHKKALEEDPLVFDYDGAYDGMKEKIARPRVQDQTERKSKYIETLMQKAKQREREHEIIYEKKQIKERSKEDHLFADKEKFVTGAYKKKLAERQQWMEEERLRELREEKEDVTKKNDLSDFYFSLNKNVAFGAHSKDSTKPSTQERANDGTQKTEGASSRTEARQYSTLDKDKVDDRSEKTSDRSQTQLEPTARISEVVVEDNDNMCAQENKKSEAVEQPSANQTAEVYKRSEDKVAAAKERYLARKRAKTQQ